MLTAETLHRYRKEFSALDSYVFLNHAANSPDSRRLRIKVNEYLDDTAFGNMREQRWFDYAESTRARLASFIGAEPHEITYVQNVSLAAGLIANGIEWQSGDAIVTTSNQFPSNIYPWVNLRKKGVEVRLVELARNENCYDTLFDQVDGNTRLLSLCFVEYNDGFRHDLRRVGEFCRERDILFFVDGAQGVGALPFDVAHNNIDFMATTGVKWLLGPCGLGFLYLRKQLLESLYVNSLGWLSVTKPYEFQRLDQEYSPSADRFEGGGSNLFGIAGLGASIELLLEVGIEDIEAQILDTNEYAARELSEKGYIIRSNLDNPFRSGILSFHHPKFSATALYEMLRSANICVSERNGAIRISPHFYNTKDDIDALVEALPRF